MGQKPIGVLLLILLFLPFITSPPLIGKGNPLPSDYNYETIPLASNYNNSVYFKAEDIRFQFTSTRVSINANYTFQNNDSSTVEINILLPFITSKSNEAKPPILEILTLDEIELDFTWQDVQIPSISTSAIFHAIKFSLLFTGNEEHTVNVQYNRDYIDGVGSWDSRTLHYNFQYCVGTALAWNHNISWANFEFWIPKKICGDINSDWYFDSFEETDTQFIGTIQYSNWLPEDELISIWWTDQVLYSHKEFMTTLLILVILGIFVCTGSVVFFLIKKYK
ncbi:MAG: hypothetical protein ACXABU_04280 [Candidatus Hodarchaeales archaeon]|jgi:hypothetical protein